MIIHRWEVARGRWENQNKPYPPPTCHSLQPPVLKIAIMNIENTQSQMRKGIREFCILSIIRRGEAYPSDIVEEMLTYRWVESNSGPPRKYFSLTAKGQAFYSELEATWNELANAVNALASKRESLVSTVTAINNPIFPDSPPPTNL